MRNITVFTVNNLPDFIYLILACYQDWIKMYFIYIYIYIYTLDA